MKTLAVLGVVLGLGACVESERSPTLNAGGEEMRCTDQDGDGYGESCSLGGDCNDTDPSIHIGCATCPFPAEGCACENGSKPVSCYLEPSANDAGSLMCHEGTRYCREGEWSSCESVFSYPREEKTASQAIVNPDAGLEKCSDCKPNCFVVRDNANPVAGGVGDAGTNTIIGDGGGIRIDTYIPDTGVDSGSGDAAVDSGYDAASCQLGSAPDIDCDGILDMYDPYPGEKPFATTNQTIFLDLAKGQTGTGAINIEFKVNSADVYFLVDQTTTMQGERDKLVADLTTGNFVADDDFDCADYDLDHQPNNELKEKGLIGAIRCYIRDANFGVGYFRELPFNNPSFTYKGVTYYSWAYGDNDEVAFRNLQDITTDVAKVTSAVQLLEPNANLDLDEAAIPALYSVVTGSGMYFGQDKMSVPQRVDCPAGTWGYPCFRNDAIPIIVLFTDASSHNGPSPNLRTYNPSSFSINSANTAKMSSLVNGSDTFANVVNLGDVTSKIVTVAGNSTGFNANYGSGSNTPFTCASGVSPDVFYQFNITSAKTVTMSTAGSEFDTALAYWSKKPVSVTTLPAITTNKNESATSMPYMFNAIDGKYLSVSGNSQGLNSDYLASDVGCNARAGSADAAFTFSLASSAKVAINAEGSTVNGSVALYSGTPAPVVYTTANNKNDTFASAQAIGALGTSMKAYSGTTDSAGNIVANYTNAQMGSGSGNASCVVADDAPDAVYSFTVSNSPTTKVRISAEESTLDTVLALTDNVAGATTMTTQIPHSSKNLTNLTPSGATLDGKLFKATSTTNATSGNNVSGTILGCGAGTDAANYDSIYQFTLGSPRTVSIDTVGTTSFDTVVGLFKGSYTANNLTTVSGSASYSDHTTAGSLGATANGKHVSVTGAGATTSGMSANYTAAQVGTACGAASSSPDAVYKFHLDTPTRIKLDTLNSGFDTVMSLHNALPDQFRIAYTGGDPPIGTPTDVSNRYVRFDGATTSSTKADVIFPTSGACTAAEASPDHVIPIRVSVAGNYEIDTIQTTNTTYDTVLGVYGTQYPTLTAIGSGADTKGSFNVGDIVGGYRTYTGSTATPVVDNPDVLGTFCGAGSTAREVFYRFQVGGTTPRTISISTAGSTIDTVIGIYNYSGDGVPSGAPANGCNDGSLAAGDLISYSMAPGDYYVVLKGKSTTSGAYRISFRDTTATQLVGCDNDTGAGPGGNKSKLTLTNLQPGDYNIVIKGKLATQYGTYNVSVKHVQWYDSITMPTTAPASLLDCNDNGGGAYGTASKIDTATKYPSGLPAGDYWVVIKGKSNTTGGFGAYNLTLTDMGAIPDGQVMCNDNAPSLTTSSITETLPAGTYYAVIKGKTSPRVGAYTMNIRDTSALANTLLACDYNSGTDGTTSVIERDLAPGTYNVIVKGKTSGAKGAYKLQVRDANTTGRLQCDYNSSGGKASFETGTLAAGTYTAIIKGVDPASAAGGAYTLSIRDATNVALADTLPLACSNPSGNGASITATSLAAGTYFVGIRGGSAGAAGQYQLHIGAGTTSSGQTYTPPTYVDTLAKLNDKDVHVMSVLSCHDDTSANSASIIADCPNARTQWQTLANETDTVNKTDEPLVFDIHADGSGLSTTVIDGIQQLAKYLTMNVTLNVNFTPDANPTPNGFAVSTKAIKQPGDGCDSVVGVEFKSCLPGAKPRFEVSFTNPLNAPVPRNPNDPKGGYSFRAELIGNGKIVDMVPIYIVPEAVVNVPPPPTYYPTGTYWQTLSGNGCAGKTDLPDWSDLSWNADVPDGTSVSFAVCTGDSAAAAENCTAPTPICTITGSAQTCSMSTPCPTGSVCSAYGNCHRITGGSCTTNTQCTGGATCQSNVCVYSNQPVDVGAALGGRNYASNLRVRIGLTANTMTNTGPVVNNWSINYLCKNAL